MLTRKGAVFILSPEQISAQEDLEGRVFLPVQRCYAPLSSITHNDREARVSEPILEPYESSRALRAWSYIFSRPRQSRSRNRRTVSLYLDLAPSAGIIAEFPPSLPHRPDGLSRRPPQPGDEPEPDLCT